MFILINLLIFTAIYRFLPILKIKRFSGRLVATFLIFFAQIIFSELLTFVQPTLITLRKQTTTINVGSEKVSNLLCHPFVCEYGKILLKSYNICSIVDKSKLVVTTHFLISLP